MRKKFNKQLFFSIFFFLLFMGAVAANELDLFKSLTTTQVVMAKDVIEKDTVITNENVWIFQMPNELVTDEMYRNVNDVVGKTATQVILPSQYVSAKALDQSLLRPTAEHEFFPIPNAWLVEIQGTLRRYDQVNISAIYAGKQDAAEVTFNSSLIKSEYILEQVPVAYVKGSRNEEVTGLQSGDDRLYGTQNPSNIQLSLTLENFKVLEKLYMEGYKFVISI
ncbi:hypothetical protein IIE26_26915 (plasmid) [Cytobacillus oceanisediminis]|uniref:SAF domain-containing protein n=1 Tax=Cytobacillus oceanisediminis TaxID=665099 RepID=UPI00186527CB|nr:SAF domain-containing protein [Cytobacillus oceanisediminis]QOK30001.1 hypothetical protein IIE26_26915 [Cytobacillus oceanisediminis]